MAVKMVISDIRSIIFENDKYPPPDEMFHELNKIISQSLLYFLRGIIAPYDSVHQFATR